MGGPQSEFNVARHNRVIIRVRHVVLVQFLVCQRPLGGPPTWLHQSLSAQINGNLDVNPYEPNDTSAGVTTPAARRWPVIVAACACVYYSISAMTLPFTNAVWIGEIPLLAILQIPKSFIKSVVHDFLLHAVHVLGLSHGSASPDYIATHGLAMFIMAAAPALLVVAVFAFLLRGRMRNKLIAAVLILATIDAIVTIWFDSSSSLKLYNASYF